VIRKTYRLGFEIDMGQLDMIILRIKLNEFGFKMTGLTIDSQMRRMGRALAMHRMAGPALGPGSAFVGRASHIRVAVNTCRIVMRVILCGAHGHLKRDRLSVYRAATFGLCVASVAKGIGRHHALVGMDIGLSVAIQADRFPSFYGVHFSACLR
jgi:hypothetical protein